MKNVGINGSWNIHFEECQNSTTIVENQGYKQKVPEYRDESNGESEVEK
jgi:hypothetical protein